MPELLRRAISARARELRVALPGIVTQFYPADATVDVKVAVDDGSGPIILYRVPVLFPGGGWGGGLYISFPIAADDNVLLIFSDRSLDEYLAGSGSGAPVKVADPRQHHLSDAVAIPGLRPAQRAWPSDPDAMLLGMAGGDRYGVGLGEAIRRELDALWQAMASHMHPTAATGPASVAAPTSYSEDKQDTVASGTVKVSP
jgi:hypothetical protein